MEYQQVGSVTAIQHICTQKNDYILHRLRPEQHSEGWIVVSGAPQHPVWKSCLRGPGAARSQEVWAQSGCLVCVSDKVSLGLPCRWLPLRFQIPYCTLHWYFLSYIIENRSYWGMITGKCFFFWRGLRCQEFVLYSFMTKLHKYKTIFKYKNILYIVQYSCWAAFTVHHWVFARHNRLQMVFPSRSNLNISNVPLVCAEVWVCLPCWQEASPSPWSPLTSNSFTRRWSTGRSAASPVTSAKVNPLVLQSDSNLIFVCIRPEFKSARECINGKWKINATTQWNVVKLAFFSFCEIEACRIK